MKSSCKRLIFTWLLCLVFSCVDSVDRPDPDRNLKPSDYPVPAATDNNVIAHRGACMEKGLPDNSREALKQAITLGCFGSECDIHITSDNRVVVCHDAVFKGLVIKDVTYNKLSEAGSLSNGEKLPLLEDFIDIVLDSGTTKLIVDVKTVADQYGGNASSIKAGQAAAALVHEKHARNFVEFIAGREDVLKKCLEAAQGEWACGYMNTGATPSYFKSKGYTWANFTVSVFYNNEALIQGFRDNNIRISTYNADTDDQMNWFLSRSMYAICTNYPEKLLYLVRKK